jgi:hypothetical protein
MVPVIFCASFTFILSNFILFFNCGYIKAGRGSLELEAWRLKLGAAGSLARKNSYMVRLVFSLEFF